MPPAWKKTTSSSGATASVHPRARVEVARAGVVAVAERDEADALVHGGQHGAFAAAALARNGPLSRRVGPYDRAVHDEGAVDDEVVTRELGFAVGLLRRTTFRRELQQVCVELGLGCEIDESTRLLTTRVLVLVRGTREGVDALVDYARVSGWSTWSDDALGGSPG